ncbi:swi5-dependent recombination DNA repair protein 1 homolog [Pristis pectinata]|uniref:swi5-dependent recombination DNA repair protein 1 homolog n=1 Tax=Pristis pectinata TaxID=685728 RepID=UPI00223D2C55|nr:swi5-dependent recombination DNA repair protein 1 homolog [Pristis pectinata]
MTDRIYLWDLAVCKGTRRRGSTTCRERARSLQRMRRQDLRLQIPESTARDRRRRSGRWRWAGNGGCECWSHEEQRARMESTTFGSPCESSSVDQFSTSIQTPVHTNTVVKTPMSASLRERLKKTRRSFNAPFIVPKRLKVDCEGEGEENSETGTDLGISQLTAETPAAGSGVNMKTESPRKKAVDEWHEMGAEGEGLRPGPSQAALRNAWTPAKSPRHYPVTVSAEQQELLEEKDRLQREVEKKEELLRRLKMVQMYRAKNNLAELGLLIEKWRKSSQTLLYELQLALSTDSKPTLTQLIDSLAVEDRLLHYNRFEEDFTDT